MCLSAAACRPALAAKFGRCLTWQPAPAPCRLVKFTKGEGQWQWQWQWQQGTRTAVACSRCTLTARMHAGSVATGMRLQAKPQVAYLAVPAAAHAVNVLTIFVESNQGDEGTTIIQKLAVFGSSACKLLCCCTTCSMGTIVLPLLVQLRCRCCRCAAARWCEPSLLPSQAWLAS